MRIGQPRRRSEEIRRKLSEESQYHIREASRRLMETSVTDQIRTGDIAGEETSEYSAFVERKRFRPGWRLLSLALCGFLAYTLFNIWKSPQYRIGEIEVQGLQRIDPTEVIAILNIKDSHVIGLDTEKIKKEILLSFPEIRKIQIIVEFPAKVNIIMVERQPIISWQAKNQSIWIDGEGFLIPTRGEKTLPLTIISDSLPPYSLEVSSDEQFVKKSVRDKASFLPNVPPLNFYAIPKKINTDMLTAILQLNAWMPQEKTLLHQSQRGLGWHDPRGWDVFVGQKLEKINDKMVMYQMIVRELERQGIRPILVSVEFLNAPYYRTGD